MGEHLCELVDCPRCSNALPSTLQSQCQAAHWPSGCFARRDDLDQHVHGTCEARPGDMGPSSHRRVCVHPPGVPCIDAFGCERIARVWRVVVHPRAHCIAARHKMWATPMLIQLSAQCQSLESGARKFLSHRKHCDRSKRPLQFATHNSRREAPRARARERFSVPICMHRVRSTAHEHAG